MGEARGSIAFFSTYRPPVPLDIFSLPIPAASRRDELPMTDGKSYNYNGQIIPPVALKAMLKRPKLASEANEDDVHFGRVSGMIFVSERSSHLETLHIALSFSDNRSPKVFGFADVYGLPDDARMEDSACFAGDNLIYISTKEDPKLRRQPWTAVYKTNLKTGKTERLTPPKVADLSPSVSPSGKRIAVASFQNKGGWQGEIKDLKTDIYVMNVDKKPSLGRICAVENGGWPTWGSDDVLFFHRNDGGKDGFFGVYRADIRDVATKGPIKEDAQRVTPEKVNAMTPAAINATTVAAAVIRGTSDFGVVRAVAQYRHIEIFDSTAGPERSTKVTLKTIPKADHFNPFVMDGGKRIGYHRCSIDRLMNGEDIERQFQKMECPHKDVGLFRVSGVFPTFSKDGSKLAFVDNEFKSLWVADEKGLRVVYEADGPDSIFSPVWNQNPDKDILYICMGPSFKANQPLNIYAIQNASKARGHRKPLTKAFNNAFPSTNKEGTKLVFRSTRDGGEKGHKSLYIMEDTERGEYAGGKITRLTTQENCTDTHCNWSPNGDWIVFSSTRKKPELSNNVKSTDNGLDPGYFAVFMVRVSNPNVVIEVMGSGRNLIGHVNHPFFSPDMKSIVVTADLAAVSVDPISLPLVSHSVRPYGDIFTIDIDPNNFDKNKKLEKFKRVTHSRYENSTATWTMFSTKDPNAKWNLQLDKKYEYTPSCPYLHGDGGESWHMTGQLCIPNSCC